MPKSRPSLRIVTANASPPTSLRGVTLSSQIVAEIREAVFSRRLEPGDFVGTEKEIAAKAGVSRMAARDALRTLEALGIVEIKVGLGGGARVAPGNPRLFAEAFAVQLHLAGTSAGEIMDAQRAIETLAAELAAEHAVPADHARLRALLKAAEDKLDDKDAFTRLGREFHLAVAESSHNRVLVAQLISLQHVSWPARNRTMTRSLAEHVLETHTKLTELIEFRDAQGARRLMDDHVKMIRARRIAEEKRSGRRPQGCC